MTERRRHYRIDDQVSLSYRVLQVQGCDDNFAAGRQRFNERSDLRNALLCVDARLDALKQKLADDQPLLAELVNLMDRKLALHQKLSGIDDIDDPGLSPAREVNLSVSGVAFTAETPVSTGTRLKLEMVLYPEHAYVPAYGRVVSCRSRRTGSSAGYTVAVEFAAISEDDQDRIMQHILRKQAEQIRRSRAPELMIAAADDAVSNN